MIPQSPTQRARIAALIKQAADALILLSEERLNLDADSRQLLNEARQAVSTFDYTVSMQPVEMGMRKGEV
jgi:hypothetical protein